MLERLQINLEYKTIEDRLLLRISQKESHGGCVEYRFWLTRRFVDVFLKGIDKIIEVGLASDVQISPDALEAMKKFQQEAALTKADFSSSYDADAKNCTLTSQEPLLVKMLKVQKKSKNKYVLSLVTDNNTGINIGADINLIHSLRKLLLSSINNAGWNQPMSRVAEEKVKVSRPSGLDS